MIFPPELVDEILAHLRHNRKALRHCSLVAKSWAYSCQKLLYTRIYITLLAYDIWRGIASPTSAELYRHVRSLTLRQTWALPDSYEDYLKSFYRLQHLTLVEVIDINLDIVNLFLPFQNTLSSLSLCYVSLTSDAFIKLLGYFPNLRVFRLTAPTFYSNPRTVPPPPTPLRGTLRLSDSFGKKGDTLLRQLCDLKLEYNELELHAVSSCTPRIHSLVSACEKTLTRLTLSSWNTKDFPLTLMNLSKLRELVFTVTSILPQEISLISTITSMDIRKILFTVYHPRDLDEYWPSLETELSSLVDRLRGLGYQHVLNLEFRLESTFTERIAEAGFDMFFPKFSEKGRVTISKYEGSRILYCSDGSVGSGLNSEEFEGSETTWWFEPQ